jgi:hypothetical protein
VDNIERDSTRSTLESGSIEPSVSKFSLPNLPFPRLSRCPSSRAVPTAVQSSTDDDKYHHMLSCHFSKFYY